MPHFCIFFSLFFVKFLTDLVNLGVLFVAQVVGAMLKSRDMRVVTYEWILAGPTELLCWNRLRNNLMFFIYRFLSLIYVLFNCVHCHSSLRSRNLRTYLLYLCYRWKDRCSYWSIYLKLWYIHTLLYDFVGWILLIDIQLLSRISNRIEYVILTFAEAFISSVWKLDHYDGSV